MGSRSRLVALVLLLSCGFAFGERPDETALLTLWGKHREDPGNHQAIAQDAQAFIQTYAQSPLAAVARGLAAWHLLEAGNSIEAARILTEMTAGGQQQISAGAAREMAFRWLTRLDAEAVKVGLRKIYATEIEYPDTLAPLAKLDKDSLPPMADRWGTPWVYSNRGFKIIDGGPKQTFDLKSSKLGVKSDLQPALAEPYGGGLGLKPEKLMPPMGGRTVLQVVGTGGVHAILAEGATAGDLGFAYFGEALVVLSNGDYWFVEPRPGS